MERASSEGTSTNTPVHGSSQVLSNGETKPPRHQEHQDSQFTAETQRAQRTNNNGTLRSLRLLCKKGGAGGSLPGAWGTPPTLPFLSFCWAGPAAYLGLRRRRGLAIGPPICTTGRVVGSTRTKRACRRITPPDSSCCGSRSWATCWPPSP